MAGRSIFDIKFDIKPLSEFSESLSRLTPEEIGRAYVDAINETVESAYDLGRARMLRGINLTDDYVQRKMKVDHATEKRPSAKITAFGSGKFTTALSHYGARQEDTDVTWSNQRIASLGIPFGKWPGWTKRTGNSALGIEANRKAAGRSVEVVKGQRKTIKNAFGIRGKTDSNGTPIVFRRKANSRTIEALTGPSVYQLFRLAATSIEGQVADDLETSVANAAEQRLREILR